MTALLEILDLFSGLYKFGLDFGFTFAQILLIGMALFFYLKPFKALKTKVEKIQSEFTEAHHAAREMQQHLLRGKNSFSTVHELDKLAWATANSPLILNPLGHALLARSGMHSVIADATHGTALLRALSDKKPASGYDVEKCAYQVIAAYVHAHPDLLAQFKDFIYENPAIHAGAMQQQVELEDIYFVGSMQLRDAYLAQHPHSGKAE